MVAELARVKALFQLRSILTVMGAPALPMYSGTPAGVPLKESSR